MTNLSTLAVLGVPVSDFSPVERMLRNLSPQRTNELVVSLECTLGRDFEALERISKGKSNVRLEHEREGLPRRLMKAWNWDKILGKEILSLGVTDEHDEEEDDDDD